MKPPVHLLKKSKIIWLNNHLCKHSHTYLSHWDCYLKENPDEIKVGYLDIETSNLDADFGIMLCYCIKVDGEDTILGRHLTEEEALNKKEPDKQLVKELIQDMSQFSLVYTYYGTGFDLKFIRTRAVSNKLKFPVFGSISHKDVYYIIKNKFKLHRSGLETACNELIGRTLKTHFDGDTWRHAVQGKQKALAWIFDHCQRDVIDLEKLTKKVMDFANPGTTKSI
jgi:uncharacterized protein YprB with RNaseH-like and TPR domain